MTLTPSDPPAPKDVAPVVFTARAKPPFTVEPREMARLPVLVSVVLPVNTHRVAVGLGSVGRDDSR